MKNIKFSKVLLSLALLGMTTTSVMAATIDSQKVGNQPNGGIQGWRPYLSSVGSKIIQGGATVDGNLTPTVGAVIEVPTYMTENELFTFIDKDGDLIASKGITGVTLPDGSLPKKNFRIEWYVLETSDWSAVNSWDDVTTKTKIETSIGGMGLNASNQHSETLVVPESAIGKRLGFIAYPETEYGIPAVGVPLKAWDLSKLWSQTPPPGPGECDPGTEDCDNNATPGGENPGGGGGEVGGSQFAITIFDAETNLPLSANSKLFVERTYFATIRINNGDNTYREPSATELNSLKWNLVDETGAVKGSYDKDSNRLGIAADTFGPENFVKYTFTTQVTNADAATGLKTLAPNFSEQGYGLYVTLETDDK